MIKYSFKKILEEEIVISSKEEKNINILLEKIEIPKMQRDYAQGRDSAKQVRDRFLDAIFESLSKEGKSMEMDFVYGAIDVDNKVFTPLDGQQRLTTLFLLYWYIGTRELETSKRKTLYNSLKKFTYETRTSSRRFCENLCNEKLIATISFQKEISEEIMNLYWFFRSYKQDPTIKSMLNMLDAIQKKYETENKKLYENLKNLRFYILPLNFFKLTDELYVKMNARGKQLTDFENFKADLIKWMKDDDNPYSKNFYEKINLDNNIDVPYYFFISQKIDSKWTNFFWNITKHYNVKEKNEEGKLVHPEGKIVDPLFIRLFFRYFFQKYIFLSKIPNTKIEKEENYKLLYDEGKYQNFKVFKEILEKDQNLVNDFKTFFDKLNEYWPVIEKTIIPSWDKKWTFLVKKFERKDRVVFLAIVLFLEQKEPFDKDEFRKWLRVVWNIVENTDIYDAPRMIDAMKLIEKLSRCAYENKIGIYTFLANDGEKTEPRFLKTAMDEERNKCNFIINKSKQDCDWEKEFISVEQHAFFKGMVSFIITDDMKINEFKHRKEMAFGVFDEEEKGVNKKYQNNGHIFLRALISRYTDFSDRNGYFFTDNGNNMKYLLASDKVVRNAVIEWFDLENKDKLENALNKSVEKDSEMQGWSQNNDLEKIRIRRAHEALYKVPELQDWMQDKGSIYFKNIYGHFYITNPGGWDYNYRIMLDTCRNEVIEYLLKKGFKTARQAVKEGKEIPYFKGYEIEVIGPIDSNKFKITFDSGTTMKIKKKTENDGWEESPPYNYVDVEKDSETIIGILDKEIFSS